MATLFNHFIHVIIIILTYFTTKWGGKLFFPIRYIGKRLQIKCIPKRKREEKKIEIIFHFYCMSCVRKREAGIKKKLRMSWSHLSIYFWASSNGRPPIFGNWAWKAINDKLLLTVRRKIVDRLNISFYSAPDCLIFSPANIIGLRLLNEITKIYLSKYINLCALWSMNMKKKLIISGCWVMKWN